MRARSPCEGRVTSADLYELLARVLLSVFLVPGETSSVMAGILEGALDSMVGLARPRHCAKSPRGESNS